MAEYAELVARYRQLRAISFELNNALVAKTPPEAVQQCAKKLGLWKDKTLVFPSEAATDVFMDYLVYDWYQDGLNAFGRRLKERPPAPGSDLEKVLLATQHAFYAILEVTEVLPEVGIRARDQLGDRDCLILDMGLSQSAHVGTLLASRLVPFEDFAITSGAGMPVDRPLVKKLMSHPLAQPRGGGAGTSPGLAPEEAVTLSTFIIRTCLDAGATDRVRYQNPDDESEVLPLERSGIPGRDRNAPCPCGSGKKYKRCCGK